MSRLKKSPQELNEKEELFCLEYIKDFNAVRSYQRTGFNAGTYGSAAVSSQKLLKNPLIIKRIEELKSKRCEKVSLSADWIVERLMEEATYHGKDGNSASRTKALEVLGKHVPGFFPTDTKNQSTQQNVVFISHEEKQSILQGFLERKGYSQDGKQSLLSHDSGGDDQLPEVPERTSIPFRSTPLRPVSDNDSGEDETGLLAGEIPPLDLPGK